MLVSEVKTLADQIRAQVGKAIVGQTDTADLLLTALFCGGHILLEGAPGTAKTLMAQCFSAALNLDFGRIQFTPDLMPGDIVGTNLFNFQTSTFTVNRGPIFCEVLLADEINRTPPKTQAALLEAMQERKVTLDGKAHHLSDRFIGHAGHLAPVIHPGADAGLNGILRHGTAAVIGEDFDRAAIVQGKDLHRQIADGMRA